MKKMGGIFLAFCFLFALTGCEHAQTESLPEDSFSVQVENQCSQTIYGIHMEYDLAQKPAGGQVVSYSPEMDIPIKTGDTLSFRLGSADFDVEPDLATFGFTLFAVCKGQEAFPAGERIALPAQKQTVYRYILSGSAEKGFSLAPTDET